jgi:GT2 family glycosyltransferase
MQPKVGIVLMNYNLPNETNNVYEALRRNLDKTNYEICVVDNASDKASASQFTTVRTIVNTRTMGAILMGAHYFNRKHDVKYVFYFHNDMAFRESPDILFDMVEHMEANENIAVIHPALNQDATPVYIGDRFTVYDPNNNGGYRRVMPNGFDAIPMDDTSPILVRKSDWNAVGGQDPRLSRCYFSGKDFYTALHRIGKEIWMYDGVVIDHHGQYTYIKEVGDESYHTLDNEAKREMEFVMSEKYGPNWRQILS